MNGAGLWLGPKRCTHFGMKLDRNEFRQAASWLTGITASWSSRGIVVHHLVGMSSDRVMVCDLELRSPYSSRNWLQLSFPRSVSSSHRPLNVWLALWSRDIVSTNSRRRCSCRERQELVLYSQSRCSAVSSATHFVTSYRDAKILPRAKLLQKVWQVIAPHLHCFDASAAVMGWRNMIFTSASVADER